MKRKLATAAPWGRRAGRALRDYYMVALSAAVIALFAAAGLGAFDPRVPPKPALTQAQTPLAPAAGFVSPAAASTPTVFSITYFIVGSEQERELMHNVGDQMVFREWLRKSSYEVLVASSPLEEAAAYRIINDAKASSGAEFHVVDLRQ